MVIVATVSCIYGIGDRDEYHNMILTMRMGDRLDQRAIVKRLTEMQYERNDVDFHRVASGYVATSSTSFRPSTPSTPSAFRSSTTRSTASSSSIRSPDTC